MRIDSLIHTTLGIPPPESYRPGNALAHVPAKWTRFADKEHAPHKESRAHSRSDLSRADSISAECALEFPGKRCISNRSNIMNRRQLLAAGPAALAVPAVAHPAKTATLRFVPQANLALLDPILTTALVTLNHAYYVFDTLYSVAADGVPRPQMASGAEVSADGRTWKIGLRDGLKFHDGSPVLARDCAASIARWAKREPFGQLLDKA